MTLLIYILHVFIVQILFDFYLNFLPKLDPIYIYIVDTQLFGVLRDKWGANITFLLSSKVIPVSGDLIDEMWGEIDFIINSAATTKYDERYDVAMDINAFGAMHILNFDKKCSKLKSLLHISTAYVHGTRSGLVLEKPFNMGETLEGAKASYLDIKAEKKAILHGWPNTYCYTKAMGEMLLEKFKENIHVIIVRPTIISSTCREPIPGWMEGLRTIDSIFVAYGKRKLKVFLGDPGSTPDVYLKKNPLVDNKGKPIKVGKPPILSSITSFRRYIRIRYLPFLKMLKLLNVIVCNHYESSYANSTRKINHVVRLAELYKPYLFFQGIFDDSNTENLRMAMRESNANVEMFDFDPKSIQWEEYFINTHFPGIVKYVLK
ncbi:hypothetical protein Pfo_017964 [Paulownia fortunei]|nr:hypothetical protein Pfo_017964 [Paulownia fortunei]